MKYILVSSAVRCGGSISDLFPVVTEVRQGCVLAPTLFNICMDWILGRMSERSSCGASFGNIKIADLDFADDAVIFAETLDNLLGALEVLNEESEPLGLQVSWVKTKIQAFNDALHGQKYVDTSSSIISFQNQGALKWSWSPLCCYNSLHSSEKAFH